MAIGCPDKRLKAYKELVKIQGENAILLWNEFEGDVPGDYYKATEDTSVFNEPTEVDIDSYQLEREQLELLERMTREYQGLQTYYNNLKINFPQLNNIHNKSIKVAIDSDGYYIPEIDSSNKRYIVNKYFRLRNGYVENKPYYPFNAGTIARSLNYVKMINADFKEDVVTFDTKREVIIFTNKVDSAKSLTTRFEDNLKEAGLSIDDLNEEFSDLPSEDTKTDSQLQAWEEVIFRKEAVKKVLIRKLAEGAENAPTIKARIDRIDAHIERLKNEKVNIEVDKIAKEDLKEINRRLNDIQANLEKELNEDQLLKIISELQEISAYTQGWMDISNIRGTLYMDEDSKADILKLSAGFKEAHDLYYLLLKPSITQYASIVSYRKFVGDELFNITADTDTLTAGVLGAAMSNVKLVQVAQDILNKAQSSIHNELQDKKNELNNWIKKLQKHLGIKDLTKISELFLQTDKKGNWTGNLVHQINQEYWDKRNDLQKNAKETGNWNSYFKFLDENTFELKEDEYKAWKKLKDSGKEIDYSKLSNQRMSNGEIVFKEKDFLQQEKLMIKFEEHKEAFIQDMINSGKYGNVTKVDGKFEFDIEELRLDFFQDLDYWNKLYNPFTKDPKYGSTRFKKYRIWDKVDSKWYDSKYERIKNDSVLKGFYDFWKERSKQNDEFLPNYTKQSSNALLNVRSNPSEYMFKGGSFKRTIGALKDEFVKSFTEDVESEYERGIVIAGKVYKSIPVGLLHANIPLEQRSKNIFDILDKHTTLSLSYKHKAAIEPVTDAIMDILDEVDAGVKANIGGETTLKKDFIRGTIFGKKGGLTNAKKQLANVINAIMYGDNKVSSYKGKKEYKLQTGEKVVFSLDKTIDSGNKFTYLKALSLPNIVSPFSNFGIGTVSNYVWAAAGEDFNEAALTKAYTKVFPSLSGNITPASKKDLIKTITWIIRLNVIPDLNAAEYLNSHNWESILTILQNKTEYINQGASTIAYLLHNKLKDKNNRDISIYDAFKEEKGQLVWDTDKMGERTESSANEIITSDKKGINIYRLERVIKGVNHHIHGDYESILLIKQGIIGRVASLFKTWLFHTTYSRFGGQKFDSDLMRATKGRYRSLVKATTKDGLELKFHNIALMMLKGMASRKAFNNLSDIDKANLMKDLREFQMIIAFSIIAMLLIGLKDGDDDEERKRTLNFLINLTTKTQADLSFYMNPNSMEQVLNNAVPIIATLGDFIAIKDAIYKTVMGDPYYENGPWKDDSRVAVSTMRAFPVLGGGVKMWNYATNQYDFN